MSTSQDASGSSQASAEQGTSDESSTDSGNGGQNSGGSDGGHSEGGGNGEESKNALEWGVTIAGVLIVLSVTGFLVYELFAGASGPPQLQITLGEPKAVEARVEVPVEVQNKGARVAEVAVIEVCAGPDDCAEVTFDYVPYESTVTGTVGFKAPLKGPLSSRVVSFRDP